MYFLTALFFLFGTVLSLQNSLSEVIWFPIEEIKNGYTSSLGEIYVTSQPNNFGFISVDGRGRRSFRSVTHESRGNGFRSEQRRNAEEAIVFPEEVFDSNPDNVLECERSCPTTPEYNPVCGSDFVNYRNMGALKCSQFCGNGVRFAHFGVCGKGLPLIFKPSPRPPKRRRTSDVSLDNW